MKPLEPSFVKEMFGNVAVICKSEDLTNAIKPINANSVILLMSSGNFDGLNPESLI